MSFGLWVVGRSSEPSWPLLLLLRRTQRYRKRVIANIMRYYITHTLTTTYHSTLARLRSVLCFSINSMFSVRVGFRSIYLLTVVPVHARSLSLSFFIFYFGFSTRAATFWVCASIRCLRAIDRFTMHTYADYVYGNSALFLSIFNSKSDLVFSFYFSVSLTRAVVAFSFRPIHLLMTAFFCRYFVTHRMRSRRWWWKNDKKILQKRMETKIKTELISRHNTSLDFFGLAISDFPWCGVDNEEERMRGKYCEQVFVFELINIIQCRSHSRNERGVLSVPYQRKNNN